MFGGNKNKKTFVAMSGGVDSSVAAALLKKQGYDVVGVHMKCWSQGSSDAHGVGVSCDSEQDAEDARRAAEVLSIPFYVFDFEKEYKDKVVEYMVDGYKKGITPNPDVMCNKEIKFGLFLKKALEMGADFVATGHYVRIRESFAFRKQNSFASAAKLSSPSASHFLLKENYNKKSQLARLRDVPQDKRSPHYELIQAVDLNKDQSYFLWTLSQKQLQYCLFPIGGYKKPEVRKLAKKFGLPNADKKDSQGICFLGQITLKDFLGDYLPKKKGRVLNTAGEVVGEHDGAHFYTIGQRGGLGIGLNKPHYIAEKDIKENAILVAEENHPTLYQKEIKLTNINFIAPITDYRLPITVYARVRYRQPLAKATLVTICKLQVTSYKLIFAQPVKFVASGQSAVFYGKNGIMLGGGVIV